MQDIYTMKEAANLLRMNYETFRRFCRDGKIPSFKIGGRYRIKAETIKLILAGEIEVK